MRSVPWIFAVATAFHAIECAATSKQELPNQLRRRDQSQSVEPDQKPSENDDQKESLYATNHPYFAQLSSESGDECGGVLIASDLVLTNAKCSVRLVTEPTTVSIGLTKGLEVSVVARDISESDLMILQLAETSKTLPDPIRMNYEDSFDWEDLMTTTIFGTHQLGSPHVEEDFFLEYSSLTQGDIVNRDILVRIDDIYVSSNKQWIVETGCSLSQDPPQEWGCSKTVVTAPVDNSVFLGKGLVITIPPKPATVVKDKPEETVVGPENETEEDAVVVAPVYRDDNNDGEDSFDCPIGCKMGEDWVDPDAIVYVPVLGQRTCAELELEASQGKFLVGGSCDSIVLQAQLVCSCGPPPTMNPTNAPSKEPSKAPSSMPTQGPTTTPSGLPSGSPTSSPTSRLPTCEAIAKRRTAVDITIDLSFANSESAESFGWFVADPDYECFRIGAPAGQYTSTSVEESIQLVPGASFIFVIQVHPGASPVGSFHIRYGDQPLVAVEEMEFANMMAIRFATPYIV